MQDFTKLKVWELAHQMTLEVYKETRSFPSGERFGLSSQIRRAAASIGANLAEGCGRGGDVDFARFVQIATGSASECEYHLLLARDLGYLEATRYDALANTAGQVKRMLISLLKRLRNTN
jgi:four helix bundle protein